MSPPAQTSSALWKGIQLLNWEIPYFIVISSIDLLPSVSVQAVKSIRLATAQRDLPAD